MAVLSPLSMSQTKEDLVKHLGIPPETYVLMAKETDRVYKWLTKDPKHLKSNCKRNPPYDWSDVLEIKKDQAMQRLAESGDIYTSYYWNLAAPTPDCPNWVAKWFLYHKFRYRDGRNRSIVKVREDGTHRHHSSQLPRQQAASTEYTYGVTNNDSFLAGSMVADSSVQSQYYQSGASSYFGYDEAHTTGHTTSGQGDVPKLRAYDPVRDI